MGIVEIIDADACRPLLDQFKMGVILPWGKATKTRLAWSAQGESKRFEKLVLQRHKSEKDLLEFLRSAPAECRRVLDTDGQCDHVFLDDLQSHGETDHQGFDRICRIWSPQKEQTEIVRSNKEAKKAFLSKKAENALLEMGGIWANRRQGSELLSTLWISESKWRKNAQVTANWVECSNPPAAWMRIKAALALYGMSIYPDALEFHQDGRIDLTVGIL